MKDYDSVGTVFDNDSVFWAMTGWRIRPRSIWVPKVDSLAGGAGVSPENSGQTGQ
jgi:hypothetical protein